MEEEACVVAEPPLHAARLVPQRHVSPRDHVAVYVREASASRASAGPTREILEARFFPLDALPEETTRATRARLAEILDGRPLSPTW